MADIPAAGWTRLAELVGDYSGLELPASRYRELQRAVRSEALAAGSDSTDAFAQRLLQVPAPAALESIVNRLTTSETYFFREPRVAWRCCARRFFRQSSAGVAMARAPSAS